MSRSYRPLKRRSDFKRAYEKGRSWANRLLVLYLARGMTPGRVGFSVGRKVGGAVVRNLVRRRLKEGCHTLLNGIDTPGDVIIIARAGASEASYTDLVGALSDLLRRAKVLY